MNTPKTVDFWLIHEIAANKYPQKKIDRKFYPGIPPDSMQLANVTSFDQTWAIGKEKFRMKIVVTLMRNTTKLIE